MPSWSSPVRLNHEWLEGRFELFEQLCLPSVVSQTNHDFDWYIYFDENTDEIFKKKIVDLQVIYPFKAKYVNIFDIEKITDELTSVYANQEFLLSTRLDSDDLLSKYYVEHLHEIVNLGKMHKKVINFDNGAILMKKGQQNFLYDYIDSSSPFSSLLEPISVRLSTILSVNHTTLHQHFDVVNVKSNPMWLQVVHGGNVSNIVRGKRVPISAFNDGFDYLEEISRSTKESNLNLFIDRYFFGSIRYIRDKFRYFLKKIYYFVKSK